MLVGVEAAGGFEVEAQAFVGNALVVVVEEEHISGGPGTSSVLDIEGVAERLVESHPGVEVEAAGWF